MHPALVKLAAQLGIAAARSNLGRRVIAVVVVVVACVLLWTIVTPTAMVMSIMSERQSQSQSSRALSSASCAVDAVSFGEPSADLPELSEGQVQTARIIYEKAIALQMGEQAAVVAIATAMQESTLGANQSISTPNADGDAGVFQQRQLPGWYGTLAQVTDVSYAAMVFLQGKKVTAADVKAAKAAGNLPAGPEGYVIPGLAQVPGWQQLSVAAASHAVQRSAFPEAVAKHERIARGLVALFRSGAARDSQAGAAALESGLCGGAGAMECAPSGLPIEQGLTPDAVRVLRCVKMQFPEITSWAGVGERPSNVDRDHQEGRAVDAMIPGWAGPAGQKLGDEVAAWLQGNADRLGVKYLIWRSKIWSVERAKEGWRECGTAAASCYAGPDSTAAHRDHVHVSVYGNQAGGPTTVSGPVASPIEAGSYTLTARFGQCSQHWAHCHTGLDFAAPEGTPVHSVMAGEVTFTGWGGAYGNLTKISHGNGLETWYAHQSCIRVQTGEKVTAGQMIGCLGTTGNSTGPHLHLEVREGGTPVDPEGWLQSKGMAI